MNTCSDAAPPKKKSASCIAFTGLLRFATSCFFGTFELYPELLLIFLASPYSACSGVDS